MTSKRVATLRSHAQAGFTLLELLVTVALLSVISVMLLSALQMGGRVWEKTSEHASVLEEVGSTRQFLNRWIGQAYPLVDRADPLRPILQFQGTRELLEFVAPAPRALGGGLAHFRIERTATDRLVVRVWGERLADGGQDASESLLLDKVTGVQFAYFGATRDGEATAWHEAWGEAARLPTLVRIVVSFPDGDPRSWIALDIAPQITAPADCEYNALSKTCRGL